MDGTLVLLHGALGDTILALPALELLARARAPLEVWGPAEGRLVPLRAPRGPASAVRTFPREALSLWSDDDAAPPDVLAPFTRVVALCGPGPLAANVARLGGVTVPPPRAGEPLDAPAAEVLLERVRAATGLEHRVDPRPRLTPAAGDLARGRALAGRERHVACHPGSGGRAKCWPAARFARALRGLPAVVLLGPAELERGLTPRDFPDATVLADPPIEDLIAVLAAAERYVGNDSGPTHLAAALGTPVLAVFGPTDPRVWAPPGARVLRGDLAALAADEVAAMLAKPLELRPSPQVE